METPTAPRPPTWRRFGAWTSQNVLAAVTLLGVFWYAIGTHSYSTFYSRLGLEPSEVGVGYGETLARAAVALPVLLVSWGLSLLVWLVATALAILLVRLWRRMRHTPSDRRFLLIEEFWIDLAIFSLVMACVVLFIALPERSRDRAEDVRGGSALTPAVFDGSNPLRLRAQHGKLTWLSDPPPGALFDATSSRLLYLGDADGMLVLFDPETDRAVKVPSNAVVLTLSR